MLMTDLLPKDDWAKLEQEIHEKFGLNGHAYDANGSPFTGHVTWCNRLCPALRQHKGAVSAICSVANQAIGAQVRHSGGFAVEDCDAGLMVICVPVFIDGELVGMVGGCGGLRDDSEPETFLIGKAAGISEDEAAALCEGIPHFTEDEAQAAARFIEGRVADIVKNFEERRAGK